MLQPREKERKGVRLDLVSTGCGDVTVTDAEVRVELWTRA